MRRFLERATRTLLKNERGLYKRKKRSMIAAGVQGRVLDFGAGFGLSLQYLALDELRERVEEVVCLEPNVHWHERLRDFHADNASDLPMTPFYGFLDEYLDQEGAGIFDSVICSQVLCSVGSDEQIATQLGLIRRALKPGGVFVFSEHVAADGLVRAGIQRILEPLWSYCGDGCSLRRRTGRRIEGFEWRQLELDRWWYRQAAPAWPQIIGHAVMPG